ncbi:hypothetical protein Tco_1343441 [Tanacetum coccineum]
MILESVENVPLIWPSIEENGVTRPNKYSELSATEAIQADCDIKATNIILQGLPPEVYALVSNHKVSKELWEIIQLLMQGTSLTKQEREYVKLVQDLHTTNIDQLHAYLGQHEFHSNESPQYGSPYQSQQYSTHQSSTPLSITYPSNDYQSSIHHNVYSPSSSIPQLEYAPTVNQQSEFSQPDSGLIVPVFQKGDDPIDAINHMMSFLTAVVTSPTYYPINQLRKFVKTLRQQATINMGEWTLVTNSGRQTSFAAGTYKGIHQEQVETILGNIGILRLQLQGRPYVQIIKEFRRSNHADCHYSKAAYHAVDLDALCSDLYTIMKAQQLEPKLYDGNVIKNTSAIVIPDSEETLMLAEESHSKMLLKTTSSNLMLGKDRLITTTRRYANSMNSPEPTLSSRPTKVEVPKELPKVSMVNTSLKKLKYHLASFNVDLFNTFNQYLVDELSEVQNVFHQMEQAVEQHRLESKTFEVKMNQVLNENERLLEQVISKDIVNMIVNSSVDNASVNVHECVKCLKLETELLNKKDFIEKEIYDKLFKSFTTLEKHCISLEVDTQLNQEIFQRDNSVSNQSAPSFDQLFELNELKAQSQEKDTVIKKLKERIKSLINQVNLKSAEISDLNASLQEKVLEITALKDDLRKLKGKALVDNAVMKHTIDPEMLKIDVEPITPKLLNKKTAHSANIKHTQEEDTVLRDLVEHVKLKNLLDHSLELACRYAKLIKELLTHISKTCPSVNNTDGKLVAVTPKNTDKRVRFTKSVTSSGYTITKIASTSNLVSNKPMLSSTGVKPSTSASGSQSSDTSGDLLCNGCMLYDNHDLCVLDFINNVNARKKSKSIKKSSNRRVWKPIGKVFTNIGYIWRPTGQTFTIVGNACPLTRITATAEVPLRKPTALENETPKPVVTLVYSRKPRKS